MLEVRSIYKKFGSQTALDQIDLKIEEGEFFSLLGPSGCGKSTLLRILAGLDEASGGEIYWKGQRIDQLPARSRPFNMVFQKYALFPHLTAAQNVAFSLELKNVPKTEIRTRVDEALDLVNLSSFAQRMPETLSGGQQQRVALARALVNRPACVLLDEPLGALDQKLRERMQTELRLLQKRLGLTFIFVTHDQEEAMILSDRIAVMNAGHLEQVSTPRELFEKPSSLFSARFVGGRNELTGIATAQGLRIGAHSFGGISACSELDTRGMGSAVRAFIRPEMLRVRRAGAGAGATAGNRLDGQIQAVLYRGAKSEVMIQAGDMILRSMMEPADASMLKVGETVDLDFAPEETHMFWAGE